MTGIAPRHARAFGAALLGLSLLLGLAIAGQELAKQADRDGGYWGFFGYPLLAATALLLAALRISRRRIAVSSLVAAATSGYFLPMLAILWLDPHPYGLTFVAAGALAALVALASRRTGRRKIALWELLMSACWGAIGYVVVVLVWLAFFYHWP